MSRKKRIQEYIKSSFGRNPMEGQMYDRTTQRMDRIRKYHVNLLEREKSTGLVDEITWNDLEMDQVFLRINHTESYAGEQVLYRRLHELKEYREEDAGVSAEERLSYLDGNPEERLEMETRLYEIGKYDSDYFLTTFLMNPNLWEVKGEWLLHLLQFCLAFFAVTSVALDHPACIVGLLVTVIVNLLMYFRTKQKYEVYLDSLGSFKKLCDFADWMKKRESRWNVFGYDAVTGALKSLKGMRTYLLNFVSRRQGAMAGDLGSVLLDYLFGITLIDVSMFNWMMRKLKNNETEVMELFRFAGEIDSDISVLSYRKSMDLWCVPEKQEKGISVKGVIHPLLSHPVENDFKLEGHAIITGANASGKSTFMKAVAVNVILAQTIHTCAAECFSLRAMHVMTCMSLKDDILAGESYYVREAKYLKRMLEQIKENKDLLCVIDEILKGTNTTERIAASKAILSYISKKECVSMVATHDMELTEEAGWEKYYFDSRIAEGDVWFDYKIHKGIGGKSNAVSLLELLDYPKEIVKEARDNLALQSCKG